MMATARFEKAGTCNPDTVDLVVANTKFNARTICVPIYHPTAVRFHRDKPTGRGLCLASNEGLPMARIYVETSIPSLAFTTKCVRKLKWWQGETGLGVGSTA